MVSDILSQTGMLTFGRFVTSTILKFVSALGKRFMSRRTMFKFKRRNSIKRIYSIIIRLGQRIITSIILSGQTTTENTERFLFSVFVRLLLKSRHQIGLNFTNGKEKGGEISVPS